jgi:hypothetical protein
MPAPDIDAATRTELEAAAFRRLVQHLRERTDVQNIDLMTMAGFCRNCLSKWYRAAAEEKGVALTDPDAREIIYGHALQGMAGEAPGRGDAPSRRRSSPPLARATDPAPGRRSRPAPLAWRAPASPIELPAPAWHHPRPPPDARMGPPHGG